MKEQNENENKNKKKRVLTKEKRFYLITGISALATLVAIVFIAVLVSGLGKVTPPTGNNSGEIETPVGGDTGNNDDVGDTGNSGDVEEPVITTPEGMILPMVATNVINDYGFYHNKTLNNYYEHTGMDFSAEIGAEVLCVEDGVVEGIYRDDVLTGTEIVIDHGNGLKSVYRFIEVAEGLSTGKQVKKGDVIATVAEANGEEYKDGAHLHFELEKDGASVDPITYLPFEEK